MIKQPPKTSKKKKGLRPLGSFAEALRDISQETARSISQDAIGKTAQNVAEDLLTGRPPARYQEQAFDSREFYLPSEEEKQVESEENKAKSAHFFRHKEKVVFSHRDKEIQMQIKILQEELAKLVGQTQALQQEVQAAASQEIVDPGVYHINFLETFIRFVQDLRKRVSDSATWFTALNSRKKRRSYYWGQVRKSGTKFLLSQERYMSTQSG